MIKSFPIGTLLVEQGILQDGNELCDNYDMAITVVGWETRMHHALPYLSQRSKSVDVIVFHSLDTVADQKNTNLNVVKTAVKSAVNVHIFASSTQCEENFVKFTELLSKRSLELGRPISLIVDISCLPKRYLLYLLGFGFKRDLLAHLDLLYSEPEKYTLSKDVPSRGLVSDGEWKSIQVPYLEGKNYAPDRRDLFISVGAELTQAMPTIERFEPENLRLYNIQGTEKRVPEEHLLAEKHILSVLESYPNITKATFALEDAVGIALDVLHNLQNSTTCFAIGSKTQALGFGLAALANDSIEVVCRSPGQYLYTDVTASGRIYYYSISDRFEPAIYLKP